MARTGGPPVADAVRVLASPVFVLALVMLILNDHVLKQAWPGLVTGKLSDFAGLVVAPLLLAVPLAALGVRRSVPVAIALTGMGFVLAKTSVAGAAATSAVWSLTGVPTLIRADVTDLVALPALGLTWWVDRRVRRSPREPWRRAVAAATGMAILPIAVMATAATSCSERMAYTSVSRVEGDFPGRPRQVEQRLALGDYSIRYTIDAARTVERAEVGLSSSDQRVPQQCDPTTPDRCWRLVAEGVGVESSSDGGTTWQPELELTSDQLGAMLEELGETCGDAPQVAAYDLAVLPTDGEPIVVIPIGEGGVYIREEDAQWERYATPELYELAASDTTEPPQPLVTPIDQPPPTEDPTGRPTPTCARPTPTTVTPNPSNGPPTTYDVCP
jgi:hypothetical protein